MAKISRNESSLRLFSLFHENRVENHVALVRKSAFDDCRIDKDGALFQIVQKR